MPTESNTLNDVLRGINSNTDISILAELFRNTENIQPNPKPKPKRARKAVLAEEENEETGEEAPKIEEKILKVDFDEDYVNMLREENEKLSFLVSLLQQKIDENIPSLKTEIDLSIYDYSSAYEATVFYSKDWFAQSLYSDQAKIDLAYYLLEAIKRYCDVNLDTLQMFAEANPEILNYSAIPRSD